MSTLIFYLFLLIKNPVTGDSIIKSNPGIASNQADSSLISKEIESLKKLALHQVNPKEALVEEIGFKEMNRDRLFFFRPKSGTKIYLNLKRLDSTEASKNENQVHQYIVDTLVYKHVKLENYIPMICNKPNIIEYNPENISTLPIQVFCSKDVARIYVCIYKNKSKSEIKILLLKDGFFDICIN